MEKLKKYFQDLRNNPNHHLGLGDIRLTVGQQEEILQIALKLAEGAWSAGWYRGHNDGLGIAVLKTLNKRYYE